MYKKYLSICIVIMFCSVTFVLFGSRQNQGEHKVVNSDSLLSVLSAGWDHYEYFDDHDGYGIMPLSSEHWFMSNIDAPTAWEVTTGSPTIYIGVIDSGIQANHPSLANLICRTRSKDFDRNRNNPFVDTVAPTGHGTKVAGLIAAQSAGRQRGVARNIRLVSLRVGIGDTMSVNWTWVEQAIIHARDIGLPIINMSLGTTANNIPNLARIRDAIDSFDGLVVGAAGNDYQNNDNRNHRVYPASFSYYYYGVGGNVISVGASMSNSRRVFVSGNPNRGSNIGVRTVDLFAPGHRMTIANSRGSYLSPAATGHGQWGTSYAAPLVAGTAALMLSVNPTLSGAELRNKIMANVRTEAVNSEIRNNTVSGGILNTYRAVRAAVDAIPQRFPNEQTVVIPHGTTYILPFGLRQNTLMEILEIPCTVTTIGRFAFLGATNLRTITNFNLIPQEIDSTTFAGVNRTHINLIVPHGTGLAFREAGWTGFHITEFDGYFEISTREDLWNMRYKPYSNFKLINEIILSSTAFDWQPDMTWAAEEQWTPIPVFYGTLYGNGYSILGLDISKVLYNSIPNMLRGSRYGLFATLNGAVQDLTIAYTQINIDASSYDLSMTTAGVVAGRLGETGLVENVIVTHALLSVIGNDMTVVGGLVGESRGAIIYSHVIGAGIQGSGHVGGLVGGMAGGTVTYSSFGSIPGYLRSLIVHMQLHTGWIGSMGGIVGFHVNGSIHDSLVESVTFFMVLLTNAQEHGVVVGRSNFQGTIYNNNVPMFFDNQSLDIFVIVSMPEDGWMLMAPDNMWQRRIPIVNPGFVTSVEPMIPATRSTAYLSSLINFRNIKNHF